MHAAPAPAARTARRGSQSVQRASDATVLVDSCGGARGPCVMQVQLAFDVTVRTVCGCQARDSGRGFGRTRSSLTNRPLRCYSCTATPARVNVRGCICVHTCAFRSCRPSCVCAHVRIPRFGCILSRVAARLLGVRRFHDHGICSAARRRHPDRWPALTRACCPSSASLCKPACDTTARACGMPASSTSARMNEFI